MIKAATEAATKERLEAEAKTEIRQVSAIVLKLLKNNERCRNDDKYLTFCVMRHYTNIYIPFEDFELMPAFETIKRVRAKIQNKDGLYPPTDPDVLKKRAARQTAFKETMARPSINPEEDYRYEERD